MKILYIHQYFNTPREPGGTRSYWFAQALTKKGHQVTMLTSRVNGKQDRLIKREQVDNIDVIYIRNRYDNKMSVSKRIFSFFKFMIISIFISLKERNIDLIYATSTPLTVGIIALLIKKIKKKKYIFEVRDLWPEVPIQLGAIQNKVIIKLLIWIETLIYKNSTHVIALSPGMKEGVIKRGIHESKVSMIPNMSKIDEFYSRNKNETIAKKFEINLNKFNVIHFGAMGITNGLDYLIDTAYELQSQGIDKVNFILLGDGMIKDKLIERTKKQNLRNIKFLEKQPMKITSEIVNLCDCSIVTFADYPILNTNSPNKLFDSLSAGKPIIVNSNGWTKDLVEDNMCGAYANIKNARDCADIIKKWSENPELIKEMGKRSRELSENVYDKSILVRLFCNVIESYV